MKNPFHSPIRAFDPRAVNDTIHRALASAGLTATSGGRGEVADTIRQALQAGGLGVTARTFNPAQAAEPDRRSPGADAEPKGPAERFEFSNRAGCRAYEVYVPQRQSAGPRDIVLMLHGCTQSARDFAIGTGMNRLADIHGFIVVYPEQTAAANTQRCWNWFQPEDQCRGSGEPSILAGLVRQVAQRYGCDGGRIFVAGLSAGAAMAVVLGQTYPDIFAAVGAHSGLPFASAHDIPSALSAMKGGRSGLAGLQARQASSGAAASPSLHAVPTIVFHGDRDHTVQCSNGGAIAAQALLAFNSKAAAPLVMSEDPDAGSTARRCSRMLYGNAASRPQVELWTLHGAGHAWSGGDARGSYTDPAGPVASAEIVRFFLAQDSATPTAG